MILPRIQRRYTFSQHFTRNPHAPAGLSLPDRGSRDGVGRDTLYDRYLAAEAIVSSKNIRAESKRRCSRSGRTWSMRLGISRGSRLMAGPCQSPIMGRSRKEW